MKKTLTLAVICACLLATAACTNRALYEQLRQGARNECDREPSDSERLRCLEKTQDDYETYRKKREAIESE